MGNPDRPNQIEEDREEGRQSADDEGHDKKKGKSKDMGMMDRLQESGKLAFTALMAGATPPELDEASKPTSSRGGDLPTTQFRSHGESSHQRTTDFGPSRTIKRILNNDEPTRAFETFLAGDEVVLPIEVRAPQQQVPQAVTAQEDFDGLDVVRLLSESDFPDREHDLEDCAHCFPQEMDELRKALFGFRSQYPFWHVLLDFSPIFLTSQEASDGMTLYFGDVDAATARSLWYQHWHDAFTSYNHEVWGDLEPLVAEAKQEIDRLAADTSSPGRQPETVALERLRQILIHVRGGH